jgi:hypothetical protein
LFLAFSHKHDVFFLVKPVDGSGQGFELYGNITHREKSINNRDPWFLVQFQTTKYLLQLRDGPSRQKGMRNVLSLAKRQLVSKSNAWDGHLAFLRERNRVHGRPASCTRWPINNCIIVPFHFKRVVPKCVKLQNTSIQDPDN